MEERYDIPPLGPRQVHVWYARREAASGRLESLLDDVERARLSAYHRAEDADRFLVGCALAKIVAASYLGVSSSCVSLSRTCPDCGRPHGKPVVLAPGTHRVELSISHSGDLVAVAFTAELPVGVDVERVDGRFSVAALGRIALSPAERRRLDAMSPQLRPRSFFVSWTRKEAAIKATGQGLRLAPDRVVVSAPDESPRLISWESDVPPGEVSMFDLSTAGSHVGAVAALGRCDTLAELDGSTLLKAVRGGER